VARNYCTYLAPHITASIQRTWVERGYVRPTGRGRRARDLWPTESIGDRRRHWRVTLTYTDDVVRIEGAAAATPSPGVVVKVAEFSHREAV
jgi:hypothetical protein